MTLGGADSRQMDNDVVNRYRRQSWVTNPGEYGRRFSELPDEIAGVCDAVRGLLRHYTGGMDVPADRICEIDSRTVAAMVRRITELDPRPLALARSADDRLVGCCRDYAVLLCSVLRERGVPARVRFGFATYFRSDFLCDHVVTEYWNANEARWSLVDAELDPDEASRLGFDSLDVPRDRFIVASDAWLQCRARKLDPNRCGVNEDICGLSFVGRYVGHDLAGLGGCEMLCWDSWGVTDVPPGSSLGEDVKRLLDQIAEATSNGSTGGYEHHAWLRPAGTARSYSAAGVKSYTLPVEASSGMR